MTVRTRGGGFVIALSFLAALMLTVLPLPDWAARLRPDWVALVLVYWCIALPDRVGVGIGWIVGLLLDALTGTLLGQHALGLSVVAYLSLRLHKRIRVMPVLQQAFTVLVLLTLNRVLILWVLGISGDHSRQWQYWIPAFIGTLLWPWLFIILRDLRRRFRVA